MSSVFRSHRLYSSLRTSELKRKTMDAHESMISHIERTKRIANEHAKAEVPVNNDLENLGCCVKEEAAATNSLTCGVPDRECNEIRDLTKNHRTH